jgi:hypothetical protein
MCPHPHPVIAAISAVLLLLGSTGRDYAGAGGASSQDRVEILSVLPAGSVTRGVEMEFTLDIEYTLDSLDDGVLSVGFNTDRPNAYRIVETRAIERGTDRLSVKAKAVPVDWQERGEFRVMVNIGPKREEANWKPLASTIRVIPVVP